MRDDGWITIRLDQLIMPSACAGCCGIATSQVMTEIEAGDWLGSLALTLVAGPAGASQVVKLPVPICSLCKAPQFRAGLWGSGIGFLLLVGFASWLWYHLSDAMPLVPFFGFLGAVFGYIFGTKIGQPRLVELKDYSRRKEAIRIRFSCPEYRALFLAGI